MSQLHERPRVPKSTSAIENDQDARKKKRTKLIASVAGGAVLLAGGAAAASRITASPDKQPSSVSDVNKSEPIEDALAVDGNSYPEKANPEYDKKFGITHLNNDGTLDAEKLFQQVGIVEVPIPTSDIAPLTETEAESTRYGRDTLGAALDAYLPNFEAIANLYNMNNPEVQMARANSPELPEDQQLLLQNANLQSQLLDALPAYASKNQLQVAPAEIVAAIGNSVPNDASLRAVMCPFRSEIPDVCRQAQDEDPNFAMLSTVYDDEGKELQEVYDVLADGTENRDVRKDIRLGIVWVNAQGEKVTTSDIRFTAQIGTIGGPTNDMDRYLSFRME